MKDFAKTKIVATIGPSSWDKDILTEMIRSGMDVARINASFADFKELERVSKLIRTISPRVAVMLDTQGHKIRVTGFTDERKLQTGENVIVVPEKGILQDDIPDKHISITYPTLHQEVSRHSNILLDDGNISLKVLDIKEEQVYCEVIQGGILKPRKTVNVPGTHLNFPSLSEKDKGDIKFAVENNFDFISASFIRNVDDVKLIGEVIGESKIKLIAKIEDSEGVINFDSILEVVDGIMVARGDLGVELPLEEIPILQKQFVYKCRAAGKPVIVATQMLESMKENIRPTRAEVSDVANAIMDGTDAVMLSAETSTGKYPIQAVEMMNRIALNVENVLRPQKVTGQTCATKETDELCRNVFDMVEDLSLKGVIIISQTGKSVRSLSRHRLNVPIWEVSNNPTLLRQDIMLRGVKGIYIKEFPLDRDGVIEKSVESVFSRGDLALTDKIAIISGSSITNRTTNAIVEIIEVKDVIAI